MVEQFEKWIFTFYEYDLAWFIIVYILLICTVIFLNRNKESIIKELSNAILVSFSILIAIFVGYRFFPNDNGLFNKLLSGEIIVGITVAAPTLYIWYKKEKESYQDQLYTELKNDYMDWYEDFYKAEIDSVLARVKLNQILDRYKMFCKESKKTDMVPIDISSLYVTIQEKLAKDSNKRHESEDGFETQKMEDTEIEISKLYRGWRKINDKIINDMSSKQYYGQYKIISAIDFNKQNSILEKFNRCTSFYGCEFKAEQFVKFIENYDGTYEFYYTVLDRALTEEELNAIKGNVKMIDYSYRDEMEEIVNVDFNAAAESSAVSGESLDKKDAIYERRDLFNFGAINSYIVGEKSIPIILDNNSNVKKNLYNKLSALISLSDLCNYNTDDGETYTLKEDNTYISRSKNYIPEIKESDKSEWEWHSWNVLTEEQCKDEQFKFFVFAVGITETRYECVVIEKAKLDEMINKKKATRDKRYYFYFAKKKQ